jgi:hypothetical protein
MSNVGALGFLKGGEPGEMANKTVEKGELGGLPLCKGSTKPNDQDPDSG